MNESRNERAQIYQDVKFIQELVAIRKRKKLLIPTMSRRTGLSEEKIIEFEAIGSDPELSLIRRYTLALDSVTTTHTLREIREEIRDLDQ